MWRLDHAFGDLFSPFLYNGQGHVASLHSGFFREYIIIFFFISYNLFILYQSCSPLPYPLPIPLSLSSSALCFFKKIFCFLTLHPKVIPPSSALGSSSPFSSQKSGALLSLCQPITAHRVTSGLSISSYTEARQGSPDRGRGSKSRQYSLY